MHVRYETMKMYLTVGDVRYPHHILMLLFYLFGPVGVVTAFRCGVRSSSRNRGSFLGQAVVVADAVELLFLTTIIGIGIIRSNFCSDSNIS